MQTVIKMKKGNLIGELALVQVEKINLRGKSRWVNALTLLDNCGTFLTPCAVFRSNAHCKAVKELKKLGWKLENC